MDSQLALSEASLLNEEYRLGPLVGTYQTRVTRSGKLIFWGLIVFFLLLVGVIAFIYFSLERDLLSFLPLAMELLPSAMGLLVLIVMFGVIFGTLRNHETLVTPVRRKILVSLYAGGFIYLEGRKQQLVTWERIRFVQRLVVKQWRTPWGYYKLKLDDTTEITLKVIIANVQELGVAIERKMTKRLLPQMAADYEANKPIVFPGLCINQHYVSKSDEKLTWNEVEKITIDPEKLAIKERGVSKDWMAAPTSQFPNVCVLETLLEQIKAEKEFSIGK